MWIQPKAHLFVVDDDTMPVHIQKWFCAIVKINKKNSRGNLNPSYFWQLADIMNIKKGDLVYFYMQTKWNRGFFDWNIRLNQWYYWVFEVVWTPFYSEKEVKWEWDFNNFYIFGSKTNLHYDEYIREDKKPPILSIRIPIKPIQDYEKYFENNYVDDNHAYIDKTDEWSLSTLLFKKIKRIWEERSITPILPEEASKISRLLFKQKLNLESPKINISKNLCRKGHDDKNIELEIKIDDSNNEVKVEAMLEAFILNKINNWENLWYLSKIIWDYDDVEFCGNQIQYWISGNKVDILILNKKQLAWSVNFRYIANVIELKKWKIDKLAIKQVIDYQKWIAQLVTFNNIKAIQPILIWKKPSSRMREETKQEIKKDLEEIEKLWLKEPIFLEYICNSNNNITFNVFNINDVIS